jgi:hypothetical protein
MFSQKHAANPETRLSVLDGIEIPPDGAEMAVIL